MQYSCIKFSESKNFKLKNKKIKFLIHTIKWNNIRTILSKRTLKSRMYEAVIPRCSASR